jgi:hypothetical protein
MKLNDLSTTDARAKKSQTTQLLPMPAGLYLYNGRRNEPCDMLTGPCSCGAWHKLSIFPGSDVLERS